MPDTTLVIVTDPAISDGELAIVPRLPQLPGEDFEVWVARCWGRAIHVAGLKECANA